MADRSCIPVTTKPPAAKLIVFDRAFGLRRRRQEGPRPQGYRSRVCPVRPHCCFGATRPARVFRSDRLSNGTLGPRLTRRSHSWFRN
jgi:hypothetical protein